jgi:hypothetical protein
LRISSQRVGDPELFCEALGGIGTVLEIEAQEVDLGPVTLVDLDETRDLGETRGAPRSPEVETPRKRGMTD